MDKSPAEQHRLIEQYVTGMMTEEEALAFEAYILPRPDWQEKVNQAIELFEQAQVQEWTNEVQQTLAQQNEKMVNTDKPATGLFSSWSVTWLSSALAFGLGALATFLLMPTPAQLPLAKVYPVILDEPRSTSVKTVKEVKVQKDVENLLLNIPVTGDLRLHYTIGMRRNGEQVFSKGHQSDEFGRLTFLLTRTNNTNSSDESITVSVIKEADGSVIREYRLNITEH